MLFLYITILVFSYLFMHLLVPHLIKLSFKIQLVDKPNSDRKIHTDATPLIGGLSIALTLLCTILLLYFENIKANSELNIIIGTSLVLMILGAIDDKKEVNPKAKLLIQMICAHVLISSNNLLSGLDWIPYLSSIPYVIQYLFLLFLIVGIINAYNLMDGIDGLVGGLFIIGFGWTSISALFLNQSFISLICASISGALFAFMHFNFSAKRKIFMGDGGSLFLSFLLISLQFYIIKFGHHSDKLPSLMLGMLALVAIPILDALRVFLGRIKNGRSPFYPDRTHLHHILLTLIPQPQKISLGIHFISTVLLVVIISMSLFTGIIKTMLFFLVFLSMLFLVVKAIKKMEDHKQMVKSLEEN